MKDAEKATYDLIILNGQNQRDYTVMMCSIYNGGQMQQEWRGSMKIEDFLEIIKNSIIEKLGNGYQVTVCKSDKNNGVVYTGLRIQKNNSPVAPIIYLNEHFRQYKNGNTTLSSITEYVVKESRKKSPYVDIQQYLTYENIRKNVVYRLVNTESNRDLLEDIPHLEFLDLSIIFRCLVTQEDIGSASILIHNVHMKLWDITIQELYHDAVMNTPRLEEYEIKDMTEVMREIMTAENSDGSDQEEYMEEFSDSVPMYVLSNKNRIEGAGCMLYPDLMKNFSEKIRSSFYIIPSSVHECLLLPTKENEQSGEIRNMIKEINDTQVSVEERLSYSLYYYDKDMGRIIKL